MANFTSGYIKISRRLLDWEWSDDPNTFALWIHLLIAANWEDKKWHGEIVNRGSLVTSLAELSSDTGVSVRGVRTGLSRLVDCGSIVVKATNKWTKITICNYDSYQCKDDASRQTNDTQVTNERQSNDIQTTTTEERKNIRKEECNKRNVNRELAEAADRLYKLYPASVIRSEGKRASLKSSEDKKKLIRLLATHTEEQLAETIRKYLAEDHGPFTKMFSTFLNNLPDYSDEQETLFNSSQPQDTVVSKIHEDGTKEIKSNGFTFMGK